MIVGKKSAKIDLERESKESLIFKINGELWELRKSQPYNIT